MTTGMTRAPGDLTPTAGQTVGPFFHYALPYPGDSELVPSGRADAIRLHGLVLDGAGDPVPDALLEVWQADAGGRVVQEPGSLRPDGFTGAVPFFAITVFARGLLNRLFTRAYVPEDAEALAATPLLAGLDEDRRKTLVATADAQGYRFDVRLQGEGETVFLRHPRH
jgi:protocatechuate 3,4-dioxygenase alpha subunit